MTCSAAVARAPACVLRCTTNDGVFFLFFLFEQILSEWNSDIGQLLQLVERSCHLINKENMLHKIA